MTGRGHSDYFADEIEWRDGPDGVRFARFPLDEDAPSSPTLIVSKFLPGTRVQTHTHDSNYAEYIIEGEQTVGKVTFRAGDVRVVKAGTGYGPITVGPKGCSVVIAFADSTRMALVPMPRMTAAPA